MIYERDGNTCQLCGCTKQLNFKLSGRNLTIHHINHDKQYCHPRNCILVCSRCNGVVERKNLKTIYEKLFQIKMYIEKGYSLK